MCCSNWKLKTVIAKRFHFKPFNKLFIRSLIFLLQFVCEMDFDCIKHNRFWFHCLKSKQSLPTFSLRIKLVSHCIILLLALLSINFDFAFTETFIFHNFPTETDAGICDYARCAKHNISYLVPMSQIIAIIEQSAECRQFVKVIMLKKGVSSLS